MLQSKDFVINPCVNGYFSVGKTLKTDLSESRSLCGLKQVIQGKASGGGITLKRCKSLATHVSVTLVGGLLASW